MCVNKSQKARFFKLLGLAETTEVLQKNRGQTHKNDRNKNETQLKAEEHEHDGSCCLKRTREQTSEVYMINQCQASVNDIDYQHDIMEDVVTFKDIHEQNTSKKETQIDLNHSHDEKVEDGVQRVEDGIMELKEIMIQIKKMIGYPENKTTPDKSLRLKQIKPTRKKIQKKPQYFRTKANEKTVNLRQKGIKENPFKKHVDNLFIVINGIRKKQKSKRYYKQRHSYLQIILQTWINSQRKSRTNKDSKKMLLKLPKHIRSSILQLRHERRNALINVYPIERQSINDYFQNLNLENGNSDTRHPMSYEWFRFGSYARYPENAPVRPIRLSAAGFFATGNGDEVKCFSCGVTYSNWLADDEAINVHRRISPHCEFVCNFDANIPISQPLNEHSENNVLQGDSATAQRSEHSIENATNLQRESYPSNTQNTSLSEHDTDNQIVPENETCTNHIQHNVDQPQSNVPNCNSNVVPPIVVERLDPLGINFQKPKYPSYAVLATRIRTYENWPENLTQNPKEMALAGFLYIGELDYCRCFFCGGGLRHWEAGDDPWVEHARWFPKCYFLRQNKGDAFVTIIQQAEKQANENNIQIGASSNHSNHIGKATEVKCSNNTEVRQTNGHHIVHEKNDDLSDGEFKLPSTLSVLQMGYSKDQVKQAISILKKTQNEKPVTGSDILSTIFAIENGDFSTSKTDTNQEDEVLQENKRLKEQKLCRICKEEDANIAFLPCGHLICCSDCAPAMRYCPSCQEYVRGTVKTWLV